ncbi:hypothetical protein HKX48_008278 [Thoreauomyces humboldtii]|nr:hypothetical protein HKX48_008278 [Thoreauomyces humboldtii]
MIRTSTLFFAALAATTQALPSSHLRVRQTIASPVPIVAGTCDDIFGTSDVNPFSRNLLQIGDAWLQAFVAPISGSVCSFSFVVTESPIGAANASLQVYTGITSGDAIAAGTAKPLLSSTALTADDRLTFNLCGSESIALQEASTYSFAIKLVAPALTGVPLTLGFEQALNSTGAFTGPSYTPAFQVVNEGIVFNLTTSSGAPVPCAGDSVTSSISASTSAASSTLVAATSAATTSVVAVGSATSSALAAASTSTAIAAQSTASTTVIVASSTVVVAESTSVIPIIETTAASTFVVVSSTAVPIATISSIADESTTFETTATVPASTTGTISNPISIVTTVIVIPTTEVIVSSTATEETTTATSTTETSTHKHLSHHHHTRHTRHSHSHHHHPATISGEPTSTETAASPSTETETATESTSTSTTTTSSSAAPSTSPVACTGDCSDCRATAWNTCETSKAYTSCIDSPTLSLCYRLACAPGQHTESYLKQCEQLEIWARYTHDDLIPEKW